MRCVRQAPSEAGVHAVTDRILYGSRSFSQQSIRAWQNSSTHHNMQPDRVVQTLQFSIRQVSRSRLPWPAPAH